MGLTLGTGAALFGLCLTVALLAVVVAVLLGAWLAYAWGENRRLARRLRKERSFRELFVDERRVEEVIRDAAREFSMGCLEHGRQIFLEDAEHMLEFAAFVERETGNIVRGRRRFQRAAAYGRRFGYPVKSDLEYIRQADREADALRGAEEGPSGTH